jgi:hypothetical protein
MVELEGKFGVDWTIFLELIVFVLIELEFDLSM